MTFEHWELVAKIFDAALNQPQGARQDFVRRECEGEEGLEAEVLRLLVADEQAGSFLEAPAITGISHHTVLGHSDFPAGSIVCGRFEILRFIGQGGMGQVYEALDLELKTRIALKAIRSEVSSDPRMLSRFRREIQLTRLITHPNVCRTFDIERHSASAADGTKSDITFLTMELLEGETLANLLRRQGRLNATEAFPLVLQMIQALSAAHSVGIIHRDFKPSNVLLVPSNDGLRVVVTDFGLARAILPGQQISAEQAATSLTGSQGLIGTLVYMAPEQFERGEATAASDTYSLGLVMYEMVTGQRPFADPVPFAEATKRLKQPAPPVSSLVPEIPAAWDAAISRCLALDPKDRFETVQRVAGAMHDPAVASGPVPVADMVAKPTPAHPRPRRKILAAVAVVAVVVSLSVMNLRLYEWRSKDSQLAAGSNILVTDIANVTGDSELGGTTELLRNELSQSAYMNLLEPSRVKEALERMKKPKDTVLEPGIAREVAWRTGVPLVVFGTVSRVAEDYKLDLKAEMIGSDPLRSKSSWAFSETAPTKKDFFDAVRHGGTWVRKLVGEAQGDIGATDRNLDDVTTSDWEALKLYCDGERMAFVDKDDEAILFYRRAAEKDPNFAMAWMRLGDTLNMQGRSGEGFGYWHKALDLSSEHRLTAREELRIKGMYASDTGDLKAAVDYFSQYSLTYPNDYHGYFYRGVPLMLMGRTEEAIQVLHEAERRAPNLYYIADHLARYNLILGNMSEVSRYTAKVRRLGYPYWADEVDGLAAVVAGDFDRAQKLFAGLDKTDDAFLRSLQPYIQASTLAEQGRYEEAISLLDDGAKKDRTVGNMSNLADKMLGKAQLYFQLGNRVKGRENAIGAIQAESSPGRLANAGTMLARAGFVSDAARLAGEIDTHALEVAIRVARLRLDGEIFLAKGRCPQALASFQRAKKEDQETAMLRDYWEHALVSCGRRQEAIDELRQMRSRPGQVWHQPEFYPPGTASALARVAKAAGS